MQKTSETLIIAEFSQYCDFSSMIISILTNFLILWWWKVVGIIDQMEFA